MPISANGNVGNLAIDTGASSSVIFKAALKKFGLTQVSATENEIVISLIR